MAPVVDVARDQAVDDSVEHPLPGVVGHPAAAAPAAVVRQRPQQAEDAARGADRELRAVQQARQPGQPPTHRAAQQRPAGPGQHPHDHRAGRAVVVRHGRDQRAGGQHVEDDVQQVAVQPAGAQHGPEAAPGEDGHRPGGAELVERQRVGGEQAHQPAARARRRAGQAGHVQRAAGRQDQGQETHVVARAAQQGGEAPQAGAQPAAGQAAFVANPHQRATRGAQHRARPLASEHAAHYARGGRTRPLAPGPGLG